jgi:hypothetical protein
VYQPACVLSSKYEQLLQIKTSVDNLPVITKLSTSLFIDKEIKKALKNQIKLRFKKACPKVINSLHQFFSGVHDKGAVLSDGFVQSLARN